MIRIPYEEIISRLKSKTELSEDDLNKKVEEKMEKLSGLVSKEGAAFIIANELGIKLLESSGKIKDIFPGMRNVETVGKVMQIYDLREFNRKDGTQGKVCSFVLGDETGTVRVAAWGDQADAVSGITEGKIVKISGAYARESKMGGKELHLNEQAKVIIDPPGVTVGDVPTATKAERKEIKDLSQDMQFVEIMGTVVQVFEPRFFEICPQCSSRLKLFQEKWVCDQHKDVQPDYSYVLNCYLDDGTDSVRVVMFRNQAEVFLGKSKEEILQFRSQPEVFEPLKTELLGEQFKIVGRPKHNQFFDRIELVANSIVKADPEEELTRVQQ